MVVLVGGRYEKWVKYNILARRKPATAKILFPGFSNISIELRNTDAIEAMESVNTCFLVFKEYGVGKLKNH